MRILDFRGTIKRIEMADTPVAVFSVEEGNFGSAFADTVFAVVARNKKSFSRGSSKCNYLGTYKGIKGATQFKRDSSRQLA